MADEKLTVEQMLEKALKDNVEIKTAFEEGKKSADDAKKEVEELKKTLAAIETKGSDLDSFKKGIQMQLDSMSELAQGKIEGEQKDVSLELQLKAFQADLDRIANPAEKGTAMKIELKAAGNMIGSTYFNGNPLDFANATKFGDIRQKPLMLLPMIPSTPIMGGESFYVEETSRTDGAAFRAEGSAAAQGDIKYSIVRKPLYEVSEFIKVAKNKINDIGWLASKIQRDLYARIERKSDDQMYTGTASAGVTYDGISAIAKALTATEVGTTRIPAATEFSVMNWAFAYIQNVAYADPTAIFVNPIDYAVMVSKMPTSQAETIKMGLTFDISKIKASPKITAGTFLIGDFTQAEREYANGITVETFNQNEDDAKNGLVMLLATGRHSFFVKDVNKACFAKGTFASLITALTA